MFELHVETLSMTRSSMNLTKHIALLLALVSNLLPVYAGTTGILEGIVRDKSSKEYLPSVSVQVLDNSMGSVTTPDGYYEIHNIRTGVYSVKFSIVGYKPVIVTNVVINADLRTRIDIEMEQSSVEMKPVEIHSQRPLIQKDQPSTMFSIGETKIQNLPISSFQDVISLQPGTTMEGNVRGGKTNEVMFYIDGIPVQDYLGGGLGIEIPKSSIAGITIYTGGFDAEYGNAMSGIVNVITRTGDNQFRMFLRFEKDNWLPSTVNKQVDQSNEGEFSISGSLVDDKLFYLSAATVKYENTRWWQDMNNYFPAPIDKALKGFSKIDYVPSPVLRLTAQSIYSWHDWRDYEFSWRYNLDGLPRRSKNSARGSLILNHILSDRTAYSLSVSGYYLNDRIGEEDKNTIVIQPYQYDFFLRYIVSGKKNWRAVSDQTVYSMKGDFTSQIDRSQLIKVGGECNFYNISSDLVKYEPQKTYFGKPLENEPMLNYSNSYRYFPRSGSIFFEDKIRFDLDGSILNVGLRWDFLDPRAQRPIVEFIPSSDSDYDQQIKGYRQASIKHAISPRIAFAAPTGPQSVVFMNFGKYFQYPLFDYLYSGVDPSKIQNGAKPVLAGNPDLNPEITTAWELGFKHSFEEYYVASVTYFRKNIKNQIDSKTLIPFDSKSGGDFGFAQYVNNAEADAEGFEIVLSRENGENFSGSLSYTYMFAEGTSELVNQSINLAQWGFPVQTSTFPLSWDQRHALKIDLETKLWYDVFIDWVVWYNSAKPYTYFPTRDGITPIDSTKDFIPNNARMKDVAFVNLKLSREFLLSDPGDTKLTLYADIRNLINTKNVKWIDSNGRIGGELSDPSAYYENRRVIVGVSLQF